WTLKVLMEAFHIQPDNSSPTFTYFSDAGFGPGDPGYNYAKRAYDLGIINHGYNETIDFHPFTPCTRAEAFLFLFRIMSFPNIPTDFHNPTNRPNIVNNLDPSESSFYIPANIKLNNLAASRGIESGNFNHYSKNSFSIAGILPLDFEHNYNSYLQELPTEILPLNPLGPGWSHTYLMYLNIVEDGANDKYVVHWPDGSLNVFQETYAGSHLFIPVTIGVFDELIYINSTIFHLKTTNQVTYTLQRFTTNDIAYVLTSAEDRNDNKLLLSYIQGQGIIPYEGASSRTSWNLEQVTDPKNRTLTFEYYPGTNYLKKVTDPLGRSVQFYFTDGSLTKFRDAMLNYTLYYYGSSANEKNLLVKIKLPKGNEITNAYVQKKLKQTQTGNNSPTTIDPTYSYSQGSSANQSTVTTPGQNNSPAVSTNYHFNTDGNVIHSDGNPGTDFVMEYNSPNAPGLPTLLRNNKTDITVNPYYNSHGLITKLETIGKDGTTKHEDFYYNSLNDLIQYTDANGNNTFYNYPGVNLESITDHLGHITHFNNINTYGQPEEIENPSNVKINYTYDPLTGLVKTESYPDLGSITTTYTYDAASRITSILNMSGQTTQVTYDQNDNVKTEQNLPLQPTTYDYDVNDNLVKVTNPLGIWTELSYEYQTDLLSSISFQNTTRQYNYYQDGSLQTFTRPDGSTLTNQYDNAGRLTADGYANYDYYTSGQYEGNLQKITHGSYETVFTYDNFNQVKTVSCDGKTITYTYDNVGNITRILYETGKPVDYTYNGINQLIKVKDWYNQETQYFYRDDGLLDYCLYPNNVKIKYEYDAAGRTTGISARKDGGTGSVIASYSFGLDNLGNHLSETIQEPFPNLVTPPAGLTEYSYNGANQIQGNGYDPNGNTITRPGYPNLTYDLRNNLTSVNGDLNSTYEYDGLGNRRKATRNGVVTRYTVDIINNANVLMETDASGTVSNYYIHGLGLISRIKPDGTTEYYIPDFRGSVVAMVQNNQGASITHKYQYNDFGELTQVEESDNNPFRYVGAYGVMYEDNLTYFMRARYYDPKIRRFLSEDPVWGTNLYQYCNNSPITNIDYSGKISVSYNKKTKLYEYSLTRRERKFLNNTKILNKKAEMVINTIETVNYLNTNLESIRKTTKSAADELKLFNDLISTMEIWGGKYITPGILDLFKSKGVQRGLKAIFYYDPAKMADDEEYRIEYIRMLDSFK
ncbi:MAG: DUF6531 domain-containing protein, partial [Bacteroidetes bacterium]|nr:DUF6531 domain-containing protein [Bacteroidota bacterium]